MQIPGSIKHLQIDKTRSRTTVVVAVATVITVFCLVSTKALLSQAAYQRRVVNAKHAADKQLEANVVAANTLVTQYNQVFEGSSPTNVIGGQNDKSPNAIPPNGNNARIVLNALPSKYDFPALITSISKLLAQDGISSGTISGSDQSAASSNTATIDPKPIPIQLTVSGSSSYANVRKVIADLERSIRPFDITSLSLSGGEKNMTFTLTMITYYQPAKSLDLTTTEIH